MHASKDDLDLLDAGFQILLVTDLRCGTCG
jgi:hypothetical protein